MKIAWINLGIIMFCLTGLGTIIYIAPTPEDSIIGEWKEVEWNFEMVDKNVKDSLAYQSLSEYAKKVSGQHLVIHESEKWYFFPDGKLILEGQDYFKEVKWSIKGRGHILQVKYGSGQTENYNISELNEEKLVLNFESDAQARGIAKLVFHRF
ncbi:MAG TPA: lipocalin family protein [Saprospiraceae bacterium]|nr:lipocalin family protein [Saprospiraceae bacterium]